MTIDTLALLRLSVGLIFLQAAISKLRDPHAFAARVAEYGVIPAAASRAISVMLIVGECWIALAHLAGAHLWIAAPVTIGLLLVFLGAVGTRLWRGVEGSCHCFGDEAPVTTLTIARLVALLTGEAVLVKAALSGDAVLVARLYPPLRLETVYVAAIWLLIFYVCITWLARMPQIATLMDSKRRSAT